MAPSLKQYAHSLQERLDLVWPKPIPAIGLKAKPGFLRIEGIRCVLWGTYGTLLHVAGGELLLEHPKEFVTGLAFEKTIEEFKMWGSMSRKPGQPSAYLLTIFRSLVFEQRSTLGILGEKYPEWSSKRIWEGVINKLLKKDYVIDRAKYGSISELSEKVSLFYHASLQGVSVYSGASEVLSHLSSLGISQGILGNGQCFTLAQLNWGLQLQGPCDLDNYIDQSLGILSAQVGGRKPSERLFNAALEAIKAKGYAPHQVLHVGVRMQDDLIGARKVGFKTCLFVGDKSSVEVAMEDLKNPVTRPDALVTDLAQVSQLFAGKS